MQHDEAQRHANITSQYNRKAGLLIQSLCRVIGEFWFKVGHKPSNLMLINKRLTNGFWPRTDGDFLEDIVPILKGYFIWASHVVQPTDDEIELMRGFPVVRSENEDDDWSPPQLLNDEPAWSDEPHVVILGDEVFSVSYSQHYAENTSSFR